MTVLKTLALNDLRVLWRTGYILVSFIIIGLFAVGASRLSLPPASVIAEIIAALVLFLAVMSPLLTVGVMLISERTEGVLTSMGVTPVPIWASILTRTFVIAFLTAAETFVLFYVAFHGNASGLLLFAGLISITSISALLGVWIVSPHTTLYAFILPMVGSAFFLGLPALALFLRINNFPLGWHPMAPAQAIIERAFGGTDPAGLLFGFGGSIFWIGVSALIAARALTRMRSPVGEA